MPRLLLLDNDALLKLARYDLLGDAVRALGFSRDEVMVLPTARYSLLPSHNRLKRCKDEPTASRLEATLSHSEVLGDVDTDLVDALNAIAGIDAGEALLFAATAQFDDARLLTGDKRAVVALGGSTEVASIAERLAGKIVTIESLMMLLIDRSFPEIQTRIRAAPDADRALTIAFGMSQAAQIETVKEALNSYQRNLAKEAPLLTLWAY